MDAMLYEIMDRSRLGDAHPASLDHFSLNEGQKVASQIVVDEPGWTPYCLEHEQRRVIFVQTAPEADISDAVFSHLKQYYEAQRVLIVPYDALEGLAEQIEPPQHLIFNFNMARCGTTLAHRILNCVDGVWNLSEMDVYGYIAQARTSGQAGDDEELIALLKACTRLLFRPPAGTQPHTLGIKFRSQILFIADLVYRAFPDASYFFMYRDGQKWANSFYRFFRNNQQPQIYNHEARDLIWWVLSNGLGPEHLEPYLDLQAEEVFPEQVLAPGWALHIEEYLKHFENGVPFFALRYNELNQDREAVTAQLLEHCGLPASALPATLLAFDDDAQKGSDIARDRPVDAFTEENYARFRETLMKHPRFKDPDLLLPDIYHRERAL